MPLATPAAGLQTQWQSRMPMAQAPQIQAQQPGIASQFGQKVATGLAEKAIAAPLAAADPTGGIVSGAAMDVLPGAIGALFNEGGKVSALDKARNFWRTRGDKAAKKAGEGLLSLQNMRMPKPQYKEMGGMTPGPLGMSDMLAAGKGKDVSKVTYKKKGGDIEDVMEISYHAPLSAKPSSDK